MDLKSAADVSNPNSLSNRFRRKRFGHFLNFIEHLPKPVKILDVGGTQSFWEQMKLTSPREVNITILNILPFQTTLPNFKMVAGDARNMKMFGDKEFEIVFSNSVLEHVGDFGEQKKSAMEMMRVGKKIFIQTPNYYFPIEPHFLFPFFQFLPSNARIFLLTHFSLGWYEKQRTHDDAAKLLKSVNLLTLRKIKELFPNAHYISERFLFFTKSFIILSERES
jgi:hypothetical protein